MKWLTGDKEAILAEISLNQRATNEGLQEIENRVKTILQTVREKGEHALQDYSEEFDKVAIDSLEVSPDQMESAYARVPQEVLEALEGAKKNILSYHEHQKQSGFIDTSRKGVLRGQLVLPLERVGVYVPGGTAAYPSSVLMNVLPAKIAGVKEIIMVTPPSVAGIPDVILAAAKIAGVSRIFQVGGAQAVAALAYGTSSIPKVDKIVGPGNIYVATAKKLVYGEVAIDMIAGPSEIGVLADASANPTYVAADLLSQAEHDVLARALLVTNSAEWAKEVEKEIERQLETLPREKIARAAVDNQGFVIVVETIEEMFEVMNALAPEHLEIQLENPLQYLGEVKNAGSVFLGAYASEPVGDYFAGTNHVLPTNGTSRFYSPLGVYDFVKHTEFTYYTKESLGEDRKSITTLARTEGLEAHARAIDIRFREEQ
ncbi:MAG: histidinol dehydrogenase [Lactobacillales bacterium]|jgi:histidinol dehydrogenase|nr:histidinol dehydrogenase [Lactobacillales bacterium]